MAVKESQSHSSTFYQDSMHRHENTAQVLKLIDEYDLYGSVAYPKAHSQARSGALSVHCRAPNDELLWLQAGVCV